MNGYGNRNRPEGNAAKRVATTTPPPWKGWPSRLTRYQRCVRFIETYCRPAKGVGFGSPLKLAPFQKRFLREALADKTDIAVLATPRGNGKSSLGGAIAVWALMDDDEWGSPQVPVIATTVMQAMRSCYGVAVSMIRAEPELLSRALIFTGIGQSRVQTPFNGGELFPVSNDPDGLQGLDPSFALVDEIGFQPQASWDSLRMGAGKRPRSLIVGVGTPGFDRDNALFHLRKGVMEGAVLPGLVLHEYAAPEGCALDDHKAWRTANPAIAARFLRISALETDLAITPPDHFRLFRLGQWVEGVDGWLGESGKLMWESLTNPYDFEEGAPTWVGVDVGLKRDSTSVVAVQERPDGRLHAICRLWVPTDERAVDITDVMAYMRELVGLYDVRAISFDPRFFDLPAKQLSDEGIPMFEVPQSPERMTGVIGNLYEMIRRSELTHDGDPTFATQVLNAVPRFNERGFTLQKSKSRGRIDAAIALALAVDQANHRVDTLVPEFVVL